MALATLDSVEALAALERALEEAARRRPGTIASVTRPLEGEVDPSALAFGSRGASDRWFCWEQPEADGFALAGVGSAVELVSRGPERFEDIATECHRVLGDAVIDATEGLPPGAGPLFLGGFAFDPGGGKASQWSSLPPALMVVPELALWRRGDDAYITIASGAGDVSTALGTLEARLLGLRPASLTPADPGPSGRVRDSDRRAPRRYERAVAAAVQRIGAGEIEKVVLAREVVVEAPSAHRPAGLFGAMRELFPSCFCFCVGTAEAAFLGASPELLVRRSGAVAATVGLAGTTRRSADPAVDDHLGEQLLRSAKNRREHEIVLQRIERTLRPHSVWVGAAEEPTLVKVANVQHLATPIHAQLVESHSAIELAGLLHPTPAVGGEPDGAALAAIGELEALDRGWYAGPVGWMDSAEDGEFCVGLRSALLRDREAHLYAGCGIVADSDPASELAESEIKLEALLPLLAA